LLKIKNGKCVAVYGSTLIHPDDLPFKAGNFAPRNQTTFVRMCEESPVRDLFPSPKRLSPFSKEADYEKEADAFVPCLTKHFNFSEDEIEKTKSGFIGGELVALNQLDNYITQGIQHYDKTRNYLDGENFASKLSPWIANGTLSVR
jgi:deoxyribodipyrimidine photo-lyase